MGLKKNIRTGRAKGTAANEGFGKFLSNAVPEQRSASEAKYSEAVQFNQTSTSFLRATSAKKPFIAGSQKGAPIPSEWKALMGANGKVPHKTVSGFYNRKTAEPFSTMSQIGYQFDPYERKQDILRKTQIDFESKIHDKANPFKNAVKQHGTF